MILRNSTQYTNTPKTFRRSSKKMIGGQGVNLQNIEKSMRVIYHPDGFDPYNQSLVERCRYWLETGDIDVFREEELENLRCFAQCDQSGAEALLVAYDSTAGDYRQLFIHNVKPHVYVALKLFKHIWEKKMALTGTPMDGFDIEAICNTPIAMLKQNPFWKDLDKLIKSSDNWSLTERYYYLAKQTVHSANYGIEAPTFRLNILEKSGGKIVVPLPEAKRFLETYRSLFPEIPESNRRIAQMVEKTGILYNIHGHPYIITDYKPEHNETKLKEFYAWPRQSGVGEITRIAFCDLQEYIEDTLQPWDILADTHDSYMTQFPLMHARECAKKMQEFMNIELVSPVDGTKFRMRSEINLGFNWSPAKPEKNENLHGLQEIKWLNN